MLIVARWQLNVRRVPRFVGRLSFLIQMDPSKILIWNVRGLNSSSRQDSVRTLVDSSRADIVCLQETKIAALPRRVLLSALGSDFTDFIELPAAGASGGILMAWRRHITCSGARRVDANSSSVQFCSGNGTNWWLTCVYGPQGNEGKIQFLQELRDIRAACHGPWIVAGDYNLIYKDEDKNNSNLNRAMMGRFRHLIDDLALKEIPLHGRKYTWSNQQDSPTLVKLDRVLCSVDWEDLFPNCLLQSMASEDSDHCPLLLGLHDNKTGKRRFHFESFWPKLEGFQDAVALTWNSVPTGPCPFSTLDNKLKAVTRSLQSWSDKTIGHVNSQLALAREVLHQLEIANDSRTLSVGEIWFKNNLKKHSLALASLKRTIARLRSRIGWLREGDANTQLFHIHARHRKRKNFISKLISQGQICTKHEDKAQLMDEFYENLLGTSMDREETINLEELGSHTHDLSSLEVPFTEQEVWSTIKQLPSDKAPGPDGFTGRFYKSCWQIIKHDIMAAVWAVWSRKFMGFSCLNSAYITLIPKKEDADQPKDFRPISLVHSFAKLITKMLANRLAGRLQQMVSPNQSAFIKGRFIQDNFMLVQQTTRFLHQQQQPRILFKLDISKAFDSVSWSFLLEVLQHLGFGQIWRDMTSGLLYSSSTQVLLNGIPGERIAHRRGLRQGDPLSPMLFILVMDVLGHMITKAAQDGMLQPLSRRAVQHRISLYADDVVLFLRPETNDIAITMDILRLFGEASGLKTNLQKSNVLPIRCSDHEIEVVQQQLPCELSNFPCKYLGLPLSLKRLTRQQIQPIIDRIAGQLPGWKADLMTRAGRKVHVQFVLTAMLIYLAMAIDFPQWALKEVEKIQRGYLWRGCKEAHGGHCLVAWDTVCHPIELGGLGISNLRNLGWALRVRWLWLQKTEPNRPWSAFPIQVPDPVRALFSVMISTNVGNGADTLFWIDRWINGRCIADLAPRLLAAVPKRRMQRRTVQEALTDRTWISDIQGALTVGVIVEYLQLWDLLYGLELQPDVDDKHIWRASASGQYSAKSAYECLFYGATKFGPYERIWRSWAPAKCRFFLWLVAHNRCWTADRLARHGLPHLEKCVLCDQEDENIDHILVSCVFSRQFWFHILRQVGLHSLAPQPTESSFDAWWERAHATTTGLTQKGLDSLIILGAWTIWKQRNRCAFDGATPRISEVLLLAGEERRLWCLAGARGLSYLSAPHPVD